MPVINRGRGTKKRNPAGRGQGKGSGGLRSAPKKVAKLSARHKVFINEWLQDMDATRAARAAGCKESCATDYGRKWLDPEYFPLVAAAAKKALERRNAIMEHKADDILRLIQVGAFLDYSLFFEPGSIAEKYWTIEESSYDLLPKEVKNIITHVERMVEWDADDEGTLIQVNTGYLKVHLIDKERMILACGKHMLGDKIQVDQRVMTIDWNQLLTKSTNPEVIDIVEERIRNLHTLPQLSDKSTNPVNQTIIQTESITKESIEKDSIG